MVIKGNARGGPGELAKHLGRTDTNERVSVLEVRGVAASDLAGALREMDRCGEELTPAQRTRAIDRLEEKLGLTGQPRVVVEHEKHGRGGDARVHWHVVWSRTDLDHMRAIRCDHNFRTHELVARELEREFGHQRVQGVHVERDGPDGERITRPDRTPSHAEMQQAQRAGIDPRAMKAEISEIWRSTDSGKAFAAALEQHGYVLARGDRRDFVILDPAGEVHSLARRVDGATAKDVRARLSDIDRDQLPDIGQAKAIQQARQAARAERGAEILGPPRAIENRIMACAEQARVSGAIVTYDGEGNRLSRADAIAARLNPAGARETFTATVFGPAAVAARLEQAGITIARVTEADLTALASLRRGEELTWLAAETNREAYRPRYFAELKAGDLAAVTRGGSVHHIDPHRLGGADKQLAAAFPRLAGVIEARTQFETDRARISALWTERRAAAAAAREARAADRELRSTARTVQRETHKVVHTTERTVGKAAAVLGRGLGMLKGVVNLLEGLFSSPPPPPSRDQQHQSALAANEAERLAEFRQFVDEQTRRSLTANTQIDRDQQRRARDEQEHAARRSRDAPARDGPER
jgi:hypothetical protein